MTLVSLLIPNYNYGRFVGECITSAQRAAEGLDYEIVVADNASSDHSLEVIKAAAKNNSHIKVIEQKSTIPFQDNWNVTLEEACGKYAHFLCADDVIMLGSLHKKIAAISQDPSISLVNQDFVETDAKLTPSRRVYCLSGTHGVEAVVWHLCRKSSNVLGGPSNFLFKNDRVTKVSAGYRWLSDMDFFLRIMENNGRYMHVPGVGYCYRHHQGMLTNTIPRDKKSDEWDLWKRRHLEKSPGFVDRLWITASGLKMSLLNRFAGSFCR